MKSDVLMTPDEFLDACFAVHRASVPAGNAYHIEIDAASADPAQKIECHCRQEGNPCPGCTKPALAPPAVQNFKSPKEEK